MATPSTQSPARRSKLSEPQQVSPNQHDLPRLPPLTLATRLTSGITSGEAMQRSKLSSPSWMALTSSSAPTISAPAALARSASCGHRGRGGGTGQVILRGLLWTIPDRFYSLLASSAEQVPRGMSPSRHRHHYHKCLPVPAKGDSRPRGQPPARQRTGPLAKTAMRTRLPVPWGSGCTPRTLWLGLRGSTPSWIARSTDSTKF
jgi:hypothetical protein